MIAAGLSWAAFALWVLARRRMLLARHGIVAGRMAVTFTALFLAGALAAGYETGGRAAVAILGTLAQVYHPLTRNPRVP